MNIIFGEGNPLLLKREDVVKLSNTERSRLLEIARNSIIKRAFYAGISVTLIGTVIYIRLNEGYFPLDIGNVIGYTLLTSSCSFLGGLIGACVGEIFSICGGIWNGLIQDLHFNGVPVLPGNRTYSQINTQSNTQGNTQSNTYSQNKYENSTAYNRHQNFLASRPWRGYP